VFVVFETLARDNEDVRRLAALILARLGSGAAVPELIRATKSQDQQSIGTILSIACARAALVSLGRSEYLPWFAAAVRDPSPYVSEDAVMAMHFVPHPSFIPLLTDIWRGNPALRHYTFPALITREAAPDLELLQEGLNDSEPFTRLRAAEVILKRISDDPALD